MASLAAYALQFPDAHLEGLKWKENKASRTSCAVCRSWRQAVLRSCTAEVLPLLSETLFELLGIWNSAQSVRQTCHATTEMGLKSLQKERIKKFGCWMFLPQLCFVDLLIHHSGQYLILCIRNTREPPKSPMGKLVPTCSCSCFSHERMCHSPPHRSHTEVTVNPFTSLPANAQVLPVQCSHRQDVCVVTALPAHFAYQWQLHKHLSTGENGSAVNGSALVKDHHFLILLCCLDFVSSNYFRRSAANFSTYLLPIPIFWWRETISKFLMKLT